MVFLLRFTQRIERYYTTMGYDDCECFECYHCGGGNNPCRDDGSHSETCLKCINEICGITTNRVTYALRESFDWNCNGRCTKCDEVGITIAIMLCEYCLKGRLLIDPNEEYDCCFLCDHEGVRHYENDNRDETEAYICRTCENEFRGMCTKRTRGEPIEFEWYDTMFPCFKCGDYAGEISVCNHHAKMIGCCPVNAISDLKL